MTVRYRVRIDTERCKGCLLCANACVRGLLKAAHDLNSRGQRYVVIEHGEACGGCQQCAQICPDAAIEIDREHSTAPAAVPRKRTAAAGLQAGGRLAGVGAGKEAS